MAEALSSSEDHSAGQSPRSLRQRVLAHPVTHILAFIGLTLGIFLAITLPLLGAFHRFHIRIDPNSERGGLTVEFGLAVAAVAALAVMARRVDKRSLSDAGFAPHGFFSETGLGLLIGGGVFSAVIAMMGAFGVYQIGSVNAHFKPLLPLALFLCIAVFQETAVRGYMFEILERRWGSGIALVATSLFFGLLHLGAPVEGLNTLQRLAGPLFISFETGLLFTAGYLLTRRLWLPIGLHWGWNLFETSIYGTANSGAWENDPNTLFAGHVRGPFLATGGAFGPEASLFCLFIGSYAGLLLLRMAIRRGQWRPFPLLNLMAHQVKYERRH